MPKDPRDILVRPVVSEKSYELVESARKYTFVVAGTANKIEVREAVERQFNVRVTAVNTLWVRGKSRRLGRLPAGTTKRWKKAIVTLAVGDSIAIFETG
ncbi:MAG: 50S ribosomal protein L23 [Fimbriimonadaceae bacterium]|nr:50S ribosomal protein L23 [Fimbriimonadaceae bacterium]